MNIAKFGAVFAAGLASAVGFALPASAASLETNVFMNIVVPNVDFLDRSSRIALTNSKSSRIRDFARVEATEQTLAANALDGWIETDKSSVASVPADDPLLTGRSVALGDTAAVAQTALADAPLPLGQEDLDRLDGLNGTEFDNLYRTRQKDALNQIAASYAEYLAKGDDTVLKGIARRELPKVKQQIAVLNKL